MNAGFHRGAVWTDVQNRALIRSMIEQVPIGEVYLNERMPGHPLVVIDGKQRIMALRGFLAGEFGVPASWFPSDHVQDAPDLTAHVGELRVRLRSQTYQGLVSGPLLATAGRLQVESWTVATFRTHLPTEADEREMFNRLNFGGDPPAARSIRDEASASEPVGSGLSVSGADAMVSEAIAAIENLAQSQSIPDDSFEPTLDRLRSWLAARSE